MNYILAIDTSFSQSCLALSDGAKILEEISLAGSPRDNDQLIFKLEDLLNRHSLDLKTIKGIAIAVGPGSYTGLRLSIAAVKGIALVTKCTIKALSVFDIFIQHYKSQDPSLEGQVLSVIDTLRGDFYCQRFSQNYSRINDPFFLTKDEIDLIRDKDPKIAIIGQIQPAGTSDLLINFPSARAMIDLYFDPNITPTPTSVLEPLYMRQTEFIKLKDSTG